MANAGVEKKARVKNLVSVISFWHGVKALVHMVWNFLLKTKIYLALFVLMIVGVLLSPVFLTTTNIMNIALQVSIIGIMSIGMTFVILSSGIDLSVSGVAAFSGMLVAYFLKFCNISVISSFLLSLLIGLACGMLSGFIIARYKFQPFIVTLSMMVATRGAAYYINNGKPIWDLGGGKMLTFFGSARFMQIVHIHLIFAIVLYVIFWLVLDKTTFGAHVYAVGGNMEAARRCGINVSLIQIIVYSISGMLAGFCGFLLTARFETGLPRAAEGYELDCIAAVVMGGTSLAGGVGTLSGTIGGVLIMGVLRNIFNLVGVSAYLQMIAKGAVIIAALFISTSQKKR